MVEQTEQYTVNLALNDQVSAGLAKIGQAWDQLDAKMKGSQAENQKGFSSVREALEKFGKSFEGTNSALSAFGTAVSESVKKGAEHLAELPKSLESIEKGLFKIAGSAGGLGTRAIAAAGGVGLLAGGVVKGLLEISRSYAESELAARNFQEQVGMSNAEVRQFERVAGMMGETKEQADAALTKISSLIEDLSTGEMSKLYQALASHEGGEALAQQAEQMRRDGKSVNEIWKVISEGISQWDPKAQMELANRQLGLKLTYVKDYASNAKEAIPVYELPTEQLKALNEQYKQLRENTDKWNQSVENSTTKVRRNFEAAVVPQLAKFMDDLVHSGFLEFLDKSADATVTLITNFSKLVNGIESVLNFIPQMQKAVAEWSPLRGVAPAISGAVSGAAEWQAGRVVEPPGSPAYKGPPPPTTSATAGGEGAVGAPEAAGGGGGAAWLIGTGATETGGGRASGGMSKADLAALGAGTSRFSREENPITIGHRAPGESISAHWRMSTNIEDRRALTPVGVQSAEQRQPFTRGATESLPTLMQESLVYQRTRTGYLRETRDVMVWLRARIEGKGEPGGGDKGEAKPQGLLSPGGGLGPGAGTGGGAGAPMGGTGGGGARQDSVTGPSDNNPLTGPQQGPSGPQQGPAPGSPTVSAAAAAPVGGGILGAGAQLPGGGGGAAMPGGAAMSGGGGAAPPRGIPFAGMGAGGATPPGGGASPFAGVGAGGAIPGGGAMPGPGAGPMVGPRLLGPGAGGALPGGGGMRAGGLMAQPGTAPIDWSPRGTGTEWPATSGTTPPGAASPYQGPSMIGAGGAMVTPRTPGEEARAASEAAGAGGMTFPEDVAPTGGMLGGFARPGTAPIDWSPRGTGTEWPTAPPGVGGGPGGGPIMVPRGGFTKSDDSPLSSVPPSGGARAESTGGAPPAAGGGHDPTTLSAGRDNKVDPKDLYGYLRGQFSKSSLVGHVPPDGARWGIKTGSADEWAALGVAVAKQESGFNTRSYNSTDPGGSKGLFQFGQGQTRFTKGGEQFDPQQSADAFVRSAEHYVGGGGNKYGTGVAALGATFGSIRRPGEAGQYIPYAQRIAASVGEQRVAGPAQPAAPSGGASSEAVRGPLGPAGGAQAPRYYGGVVNVGGEQFHFGTGAPRAGKGSLPYGDYPINIAARGYTPTTGQLGPVGQRIGSIATIGGAGGELKDPRLGGAERAGIQIHPNMHGNDLDRLYTAGCFSVPPREWPRFKEALLREAKSHPEGIYLHTDRTGVATIGPRDVGITTQVAARDGVDPGADTEQTRTRASARASDGASSAKADPAAEGREASRKVDQDLAKQSAPPSTMLGMAKVDVNFGNEKKGDAATSEGKFKDIRVAQTPQLAPTGGDGAKWNQNVEE